MTLGISKVPENEPAIDQKSPNGSIPLRPSEELFNRLLVVVPLGKFTVHSCPLCAPSPVVQVAPSNPVLSRYQIAVSLWVHRGLKWIEAIMKPVQTIADDVEKVRVGGGFM